MLIPALPLLAGVALATAGGVYVVTREEKISKKDLPKFGLPPDTKTSGTVTVTRAKKLPLKVKAMPAVPRIPARMKKKTQAQQVAEFRQQWVPIYLKYEGCKKWYWGFNVLKLSTDAAAYGGAGIVAQIIDWIMAYTGLSFLTDLVNLKFRFKLSKYSVAELDSDKAWVTTASMRKRIAPWTPRDAPPVPLPGQKGWSVAWLNKRVGGIYEDGDRMLTVIRPRTKGPIYSGEPLYEWTWLIATKELRTLLRHGKINLTGVAKVQCGRGTWNATFKRYVKDIYK